MCLLASTHSQLLQYKNYILSTAIAAVLLALSDGRLKSESFDT